MLLISGCREVSALEVCSPAVRDAPAVGTCTLAISGALSAGLSAQCQKRVRSIFSADGQLPSTASPSTPEVGSAMTDLRGKNPLL